MRALLTARALFITLAMVLISSSAAQAQRIEFIGALSIYAQQAGSTCNDYNPIGNRYVIRFRPAGLGENGTDSNLNLFDLDHATGLRLDNATFDTNWRQVTETVVGGRSGTNNQNATYVRFTSQIPSPITSSTFQLQIVGEIYNFDFQPGCWVQFLASGVRRFEDQ